MPNPTAPGKLGELARAVYGVTESLPAYALSQMNNILAEEIVLAILRALSPPSEGMVEAAWDIGGWGDNGGIERRSPDEEFTAMIDHLIDGKGK